MNFVQSSLYSMAVALCVFAAGLLRDRQSSARRTFDYFTLFLVVEALGFTFELLMVHPATPLKALWLALRMATSLFVAPCLWFAIKESVENNRPSLAAVGRWHWIAIAFGIALLLPLVETAHLGLDYYNPDRVLSVLHSRVIHGGMLGCIAIFAGQVPFYLWRSRRLLGAFHSASPEPASPWLHLPLYVVLTTWALGLLRTLHCATHAPRELSLLFALTDVSVTAGAIYLIVRRVSVDNARRSLAPAAERVPSTRPLFTATSVDANSDLADVKYRKSPLTPELRERIRLKLEAALRDDSLCCDSLLNLRTLSQAIKENARYVSQVINQDLNTTFYELLNRQRVERARQLLRDAPDRTVLDVALAVGFNSKSTFNAAFLRVTGLTPTAFRSGKLH